MIQGNNPQQDEQAAGSPNEGEPVFLVVGKLQRPHGVRGEIFLELITDFPERLRRGKTVYAGPQHRPLKIQTSRKIKAGLLVVFEEYKTLEAVGELRNQLVYVRAEDLPILPEGDYYHHQVLGLRVLDDAGRMLGVLSDILETGANDVFVIRPESGPEILLPALESVILDVDLQHGEMRVKVPPGIQNETTKDG
jgi:16S rRNA processing protein RimM